MPPVDDTDAGKDAALEDALNQLAAGDGDDPDAVTDDDTSVDDDASTDDGDAAASDSDDDTTAADDGDGSDDDTDATVDGDSASEFDQLLAKYGGDKEKLAKSVWEQGNSLSRLHGEIQSLKDLIANQKVTPEDEAKVIAEDPDVREVAEELASIEDEGRTAYDKQQSLIASFGKQENVVARLEGQLEAAVKAGDPDMKAEISSQLSDARRRLDQIQSQYNESKRDLGRLVKEKRRLERQKQKAESDAKSNMDKAKQQELSNRAQAEQTRTEFDSAYRAEATKYGIKEGSKQFAVLRQSVKDRITAYLRSLPSDAPRIDIPRAVLALMGEYADVTGLKVRDAKRSAQKRAATGKTPAGTKVKPKGKVPTDRTGKYWDPAFSRKRAKQLLG